MFTDDQKFLLRLPVPSLDLPELKISGNKHLSDMAYAVRAMKIGYGEIGTDIHAILIVLGAIPGSQEERHALIKQGS